MSESSDRAALASLQAENANLLVRLEEAEEALRAIREGDGVFPRTDAQTLHRLMVETMNEAGFALSSDGLLLYVNERAAMLLKWPRTALLGRQLAELVAPQDAERLCRLLDASSQGTADDRVVFVAADGSAVPFQLWASQLDRPAEHTICLVGTDLTRLEADRALVAQLVEQQQAVCASRAEALELMAQAVAAREQAAQAVHELRESDRRKDAFLATLAHELRNPLAPIRNALEILRLGTGGGMTGNPLALKAQEIMERQVAHLVRLVDDLLEVSRISRGKIELRTERVELATVVGNAVETVRPLIDAARQRLEIGLPREPLWLDADPVRLAQVFGNLLNNASKYSGPGGEIRIEARVCDGWVRVAVRDTGAGIPAELLPRVFDMFQQGDPSQLQVQGGLGIGLSLVKGLVELHGGQVAAHSPGSGRGSELVVHLPLVPELARSQTQPGEAAASDLAGTPGRADPLRILIVDDNRDAADSLATLLGLMGGETRVAYDGVSALKALDAATPSLAILDIGMPGMSGHELARRIGARPECRHTTLVAMTGRCQETDRQQSLALGFDRHLAKPVSIEALDALLSDLRERERERGVSGPGSELG